MIITIDDKVMVFKPEDDIDWFDLGRITKNIHCNIKKDRSHLDTEIKAVSIPITEVLNMLSNGKLMEDED